MGSDGKCSCVWGRSSARWQQLERPSKSTRAPVRRSIVQRAVAQSGSSCCQTPVEPHGLPQSAIAQARLRDCRKSAIGGPRASAFGFHPRGRWEELSCAIRRRRSRPIVQAPLARLPVGLGSACPRASSRHESFLNRPRSPGGIVTRKKTNIVRVMKGYSAVLADVVLLIA